MKYVVFSFLKIRCPWWKALLLKVSQFTLTINYRSNKLGSSQFLNSVGRHNARSNLTKIKLLSLSSLTELHRKLPSEWEVAWYTVHNLAFREYIKQMKYNISNDGNYLVMRCAFYSAKIGEGGEKNDGLSEIS